MDIAAEATRWEASTRAMQTPAPFEDTVVRDVKREHPTNALRIIAAYRLGWHLCEQRHRQEAEEQRERFARAMGGEAARNPRFMQPHGLDDDQGLRDARTTQD